jgi:adenine/guanine phosphoribosyltransferase-like PRPP-binding protein
VNQAGGEIVSIRFFIELSFLKGRDRLASQSVRSLVVF